MKNFSKYCIETANDGSDGDVTRSVDNIRRRADQLTDVRRFEDELDEVDEVIVKFRTSTVFQSISDSENVIGTVDASSADRTNDQSVEDNKHGLFAIRRVGSFYSGICHHIRDPHGPKRFWSQLNNSKR